MSEERIGYLWPQTYHSCWQKLFLCQVPGWWLMVSQIFCGNLMGKTQAIERWDKWINMWWYCLYLININTNVPMVQQYSVTLKVMAIISVLRPPTCTTSLGGKGLSKTEIMLVSYGMPFNCGLHSHSPHKVKMKASTPCTPLPFWHVICHTADFEWPLILGHSGGAWVSFHLSAANICVRSSWGLGDLHLSSLELLKQCT